MFLEHCEFVEIDVHVTNSDIWAADKRVWDSSPLEGLGISVVNYLAIDISNVE